MTSLRCTSGGTRTTNLPLKSPTPAARWQYLPELTFIRLRDGEGAWLYSLVAKRGYEL